MVKSTQRQRVKTQKSSRHAPATGRRRDTVVATKSKAKSPAGAGAKARDEGRAGKPTTGRQPAAKAAGRGAKSAQLQKSKQLKVDAATIKQVDGKQVDGSAARAKAAVKQSRASMPVVMKAVVTAQAKARTATQAKATAHSDDAVFGKEVVHEKEVRGANSKTSHAANNFAMNGKSLLDAGPNGYRNGHQSLAAAAPPSKVGKIMGKTQHVEPVDLSPDYRPSDKEPFMNARQRSYFKGKLQQLKDDIIKQNRETLQTLHEDNGQHSDLADRATSETERALELRTRDRQRKLVNKIDAAIARIDDGSYGYCEETGEPISLKRLDARPIATLSLEAQERHERREKVYRED